MVGMGLHHKICHTLGGTFDLPHADVHAIVLPYVAEFNASAAPGAMARVAMALGGLAASDAGRCLYDLRRKTCPKQSLASLGMAQSDIRSEEHTSELQSLMRISYAVFCLKKKK